MSNEDIDFLSASQELKTRELEDALKLHTFRFKNGKASDVSELINLCDKYPEEAVDYLFSGDITQWLRGQGRTDLVNISRKILSKFSSLSISEKIFSYSSYLPSEERRKGLEIFVRELCTIEGFQAKPKIFFQPNMLDFGQIPIGYEITAKLQILNEGRGFVWGNVTTLSGLPGLSVPYNVNSLTEKELCIKLNTLKVRAGKYKGFIILKLEDINEDYKIPGILRGS